MEQAVEIRILARQGQSIRQIARHTGLSRNTVRRYLRDQQAARYATRERRDTKLDAYKPYLLSRVDAARPHWIPATVLLREIRALGYQGGITQLKVFLAPYKQASADPVVRFETPPGQQMQADFTVVRGGRRPLRAFVGVLGYSRATSVRFCAGETAANWRLGLKHAFNDFGGVPEHVLFDNTKGIVIERDAYGIGKHRWHTELLACAEHYGFVPRLCRPYRAKTKGKVERFNGYLKGSFVVPLAAQLRQAGLSLDITAANAHVGRWLAEVAHMRVHGTTGVRPCDRLAEEQATLQALPDMAAAVLPVPAPCARPVPVESFQHPLSVYDALLQVPA